MPLMPGNRNIGRNIAELESTGRPRAQSVAIALKKAGKGRKKKKTKTAQSSK